MVPARLRRVFAWGYRYGEVPLDKLPEVSDGTKITQRPSDVETRAPVAVSLGCHVRGVCLPHPDLQDSDTMRAGITKRFARKPPTADPGMLGRLKVFVRDWLKANMTPLDRDTDVSFETWIAGTNYPEWRRAELRECWERYQVDHWNAKIAKVKCFAKDEFYGEYKHARGICSRSDTYKCITGPYYKCIEEVLYDRPEFIKHVPVKDRPKYVRDLLEREGSRYMATDYTSFEALFTPELMDAVEMQLYEYMLEHVLDGSSVLRMVRSVQLGINTCDFKYVTVKIPGKRMSGEMCTSLGNGFSNLMLMLFMCSEVGTRNVMGCVEGDDGLFRGDGPFPSGKDFERLGLIIKLEVHDQINTASFCGMIFDTSDFIIVTDVMSQLARFGWSSGKYSFVPQRILRRLLRSKALSMAYSYPGCPVLHALAKYGLRVTKDQRHANVSKYADGWWGREKERTQSEMALDDVLAVEPTMGARLLVERKYNLSVEDQLAIESYLTSLDRLTVLDDPVILANCHPHWEHYAAAYVWESVCEQQAASRFGDWPRMRGHVPAWSAAART